MKALQGSGSALRDPRRAPVHRRTPPPRRVPNKAMRSREYLTTDEVERLIQAASAVGRHGQRDATLMLIAFRHGLRVGELVSLRWDQIDLERGAIHVNRLKNGNPSVHPLGTRERSALRGIAGGIHLFGHVFVTERDGPLTTSNVRKIIARAGLKAGLAFPVHPHMFRHACGYKLANDGQDTRAIQQYLGHRNIVHTVRYTELAPDRFKGFWKD